MMPRRPLKGAAPGLSCVSGSGIQPTFYNHSPEFGDTQDMPSTVALRAALAMEPSRRDARTLHRYAEPDRTLIDSRTVAWLVVGMVSMLAGTRMIEPQSVECGAAYDSFVGHLVLTVREVLGELQLAQLAVV